MAIQDDSRGLTSISGVLAKYATQKSKHLAAFKQVLTEAPQVNSMV